MRNLLVLFLVFTVGCPELDYCVPNETRCFDNQAQICGSDQRWRTFLDCTELDPGDWVCCKVPEDPESGTPEGYTCVQRSCSEL